MSGQTAQRVTGRPDPACEQVIALVARRRNVPGEVLTSRSRCRFAAARARQLAMYLAHVTLGRSLTQVGAVFGRDRTTVSYACALIEDLRDDPRFDDEVSELEQRIAGIVGEVVHAH